MKKTLIMLISLTLVMASMAFASNDKLKNPKGLYPNKKPLINNTPAVSVMSGNVKHLKVRNHTNTKKVKAVSSVTNRPKRLRKRGR